MKNHKGAIKGFHHFSRAWYAEANRRGESADFIDEIMIGHYHPDGGTSGEFAVRWTTVGGKPTPRLEAFNDAWHTLYCFRHLLKEMAAVDDQHISPEEFCNLLTRIGFKDLTATLNPYKKGE